MSQPPLAPDFGVIAPPLADGVSTHSGSPVAFNSVGAGILGTKVSGSKLVAGLATVPRSDSETQPMRVLGTLTLTTDQWDAVTLRGGAIVAGGLVPGAVYVQWAAGKINEGAAFMSVGDIQWVVGVALDENTLLINPRRHAIAN